MHINIRLFAIFIFLTVPLQNSFSQEDVLYEYIRENNNSQIEGSEIIDFDSCVFVVSVASLDVGVKTEPECKKVGELKAKKEMLSFINGSAIFSCTSLKTEETIGSKGDNMVSELVQKYVEIIKENVTGLINGTKPLGGWYSNNRLLS